MTAESTEPPQASDTPPPKPSSSARAAIFILLGLLLLAVAIAAFPYWWDRAGFPAPAAPAGVFDADLLRGEVAALSARLARLEARPVAAASGLDEDRLTALEQAMKAASATTLAGDIDTLSKQVAELRRNSADAAALLRLADRVEKAEAALRELQARRASAAALLLAVGQLREAVALGRPYDAELRAVRVLAGEDTEPVAALDGLKERAGTGIRTRAALTDTFVSLAPRIIRAEILPEEDGWQRRVADRMLALVTVRREDGASAGASAAAVVARAQGALARADLAAACAELADLTGGPAQAAASWLAEARGRLAADKALSELTAQTLAVAGAKP